MDTFDAAALLGLSATTAGAYLAAGEAVALLTAGAILLAFAARGPRHHTGATTVGDTAPQRTD